VAAVLRLDDARRARKGKGAKGDKPSAGPGKPAPARKPAPRSRGFLTRFVPEPGSLRRPTYVVAGCALLYGLWVFGPLRSAADWVADGIDARAQAAGFRLDAVEIAGAEGRASADVERALQLTPGQTILRLDLDAALARVEAVDWVKSASVMRLLPNTVYVSVEARHPYALWQHKNTVQVIDSEGRIIRVASAGDYTKLPLVVGQGAPVEAKAMIDALAQYPRVASETDSMVFVGGRRWNLHLKSGANVMLPEFGMLEALEKLERIDSEKDLLALPLDRIDMRLPEQMTVRPKTTMPVADTSAPTPGTAAATPVAVPSESVKET